MINDPRDKWNRRWREQSGEALVADSWLLEEIDLLPVGRALDLACGRGRNALELARRLPALVVDIDAETDEILSVSEVSGNNAWGRLPMPNI